MGRDEGALKTTGVEPREGELRPARRPPGLVEEMDRLMARVFPGGWFGPMPWERPLWSRFAAGLEARLPPVDIVERDDEIVVKAEVPGVAKDDIEVSLTADAITIKAKTAREEQEEKGDYSRCEIARGSFARTVALPAPVDVDEANARYADGLLEVTLKKTEGARRRNVEIT